MLDYGMGGSLFKYFVLLGVFLLVSTNWITADLYIFFVLIYLFGLFCTSIVKLLDYLRSEQNQDDKKKVLLKIFSGVLGGFFALTGGTLSILAFTDDGDMLEAGVASLFLGLFLIRASFKKPEDIGHLE